MAVTWNDGAALTKWLKHYSSAQDILIVGDGDFSFSLALATAFGSGANLVATSLDSYADLNIKYSDATSNVTKLEAMGATVLHGVDVKDMNLHANLQLRWFDRIVFNFPHAGSHKELVRSIFATARHMLRRHGEIHVTHKTKHPYSMWGIEQLASQSSLAMVEQAAFQIQDYPGYNQKRGSSWRCDQDFAIGDCCTFKFCLEWWASDDDRFF
uniref:25S rRNA (uridine-N(3))-methyltransferase BMT5-like domain-containing protein n=1 Tax=Triticum aestivum TaxID=4565 RepID=Q2L3S5_WHEAT|nr:hypothetical protein [Triticum aestivum]CAJ19357.1 hypothetical protein [Triticum aestivum]